ncbi:hypothetical protein cyc_03967 [Cyclospora cayetanensis]|uniref:Uncharacterized protein n=1 Tax=Cyclospora cayetanensis TaxID=88456 RepID=A0A1D3D7Y2_9EIME|nr:hypothetical protein cyc_03967 [Cyclospora cayetanensis]
MRPEYELLLHAQAATPLGAPEHLLLRVSVSPRGVADTEGGGSRSEQRTMETGEYRIDGGEGLSAEVSGLNGGATKTNPQRRRSGAPGMQEDSRLPSKHG